MNSRKKKLDPLAKRKIATTNIEHRRNIMLRDETVTVIEDNDSDEVSPKMYRNKRKTASEIEYGVSHSSKKKRSHSPKTTGKQQEYSFLRKLPHSGHYPKILTDKKEEKNFSLNESIIENSDSESLGLQSSRSSRKNIKFCAFGDGEGEIGLDTSKSVIEDNETFFFDVLVEANLTDRTEPKEDDETYLIGDNTSTVLQNKIHEEFATNKSQNKYGDKTCSLSGIGADSWDKPVEEHEENRPLEGESTKALQEEIHLDRVADTYCIKETYALDIVTSANSTTYLGDGNCLDLKGESEITLQNLDTKTKRYKSKDAIETTSNLDLEGESEIALQNLNTTTKNKDEMETSSLEVVITGTSHTEKPVVQDSDETRSLDSENGISLPNETNQDTSATQPEKNDGNDDFIDNDIIRNDINFNQESLDIINESDIGIHLNDVQIEDKAAEIIQNDNIIDSSFPANEGTSSGNAGSSHNIEVKRQIKRAAALFKSSCIDFTSDNEDFSPGSSDYWSPCESEVSISNESKKKKVKKQKKKKQQAKNEITRKKVPRTNKRKIQKVLKRSGKSYKNRKGKDVEAKAMKDNPCVAGTCARKCYDIPEDRRKSIFDHYWGLDPQHQRDWIVMHSKISEVKRKKTKLNISRRHKTVEYFINDGEGVRKVCQKFLINTLDISQKLLQYSNDHAIEGLALPDQRSFNGVIKYSEESKKYVREFIDKLPAVSSHYCRRKSQRLYLPQDYKNITNLYRIYSENCKTECIERVSEVIFRKIFNEEYNLSFHVPKKDKCVQCVKAENEKNLTETEQESLNLHVQEKKASHDRFKIHQNLQSDDTVTTSFDLQKVLNTPYGESMLLYYSRKYSMFNLTFYESQTQNGFCYLWGESDAKRGSNEVATCITKYLKDVDMRKKKIVLLYCDACSGQNKNKVVISALHQFLTTSENIQVIQINFLLPGHSYMPVDSMHAVIEREVKRLIVWSPSQWPTYIEAARKNPHPYKVETLEYSDIIDWNDLTEKAFRGNPLKDLRKVRVITIKKKNLKNIEIKYSMQDNAETHKIGIFQNPPSKKGKGKGKNKITRTSKPDEINEYQNIQLQPLYTRQINISEPKYNDLRKLCNNGTIPKRYHKEYLSLPTSASSRDKLPETDDEEENEDDDKEND